VDRKTQHERLIELKLQELQSMSDKKMDVIIGNWSVFAVNCGNKIALRGGKGNK
jgi:hypothetical protein